MRNTGVAKNRPRTNELLKVYRWTIRKKNGTMNKKHDEQKRKIQLMEFERYQCVRLCTHIYFFQLENFLMADKPTYEELKKALQASEKKFKDLYENSVMGLFQTGIDGRVLMLNRKCAEIFGYESPEQALEAVKNVNDIYVHPEERLKLIADIKKNGFIRDLEIECKKSNGDLFWININTIKSVEKNGSIFLNGFLTDITERKFAEAELKKFKAISDQANYGTAIVDLDGNFIYINERFAAMHGFCPDELAGKNLEIFHNKDQKGYVSKLNKKFMNEGGYTAEEVWHTRKDGSVFPTLMNGFIIKKNDGFPHLLAATAVDISHRKQAAKELRASQEQLQSIIDNAPAVIYLKDKQGKYILVNRQYETLFHTTKKAMIGKTDNDIFPREISDLLIKNDLKVIEAVMPLEFEENILHDDGIHTYISIKFPIFNTSGEVSCICGISSDISARKQAERELAKSHEKLRNLSAYLQATREQERIRIAREVHDDLGQVLTAIKLDVSWLKGKIPEQEKAAVKKAEKTIVLVHNAIKSVQRIISELRPGLLNDLGLIAAMEWQLKKFEARTGINADMTIDPEEPELNDALSTTIFRIFQETLTNITRHSQATHIEVRLNKKDGRIELIVKDNGIGITEDQIAHRNSFGLMGMVERAHTVGGKIKISGNPEKGTMVAVSVPVKK